MSGVIAEEIGVRYDPQEIAITVDVKSGLDILMRVLLEPGDNVGVMTPFWVTYPESVTIAHAIPCFLKSGENLRPNLEKLR